jgi:cytochrome c biogenesis protein CcdA
MTDEAGVARGATATQARRARWRVGGWLGAALALGAVGWAAWYQGALPGLEWVRPDAPAAMAAVGFLTGLGAFFAPCAFTLFPAYLSYYLSLGDAGPRRALALGLACAAGGVAFFALVGAAVAAAGGVVGPYLVATKPFVALFVVGLGVVQVLDVRLPTLVAARLGPAATLGPGPAVFLYGFGYALASTGCTLPLYASLVILPLTSGSAGVALLTFLAFALAMALLMLLTTVAVGLAKRNLLGAMQRSVVPIERASGVVLIAAGLYLGWFYWMAGM